MDYLLTKVHSGDLLVVAVSGGMDSMALLHLLTNVRKKIDIQLICAHINHKKRIESDEELIFVKEYCNQHQILFESMEFTDYTNENFHHQARRKRYDFFKKVVHQYKANFLLTAHHGDDLMETILMRLTRGSSFRGYAGFEREIKKNGYTILRPLIMVGREQINDYINEHQIPFVVDSSNVEDVYTRNRFRKEIIPFLKNENKDVLNKFVKFSELIYEYDSYFECELNKVIHQVYHDKEIQVDAFVELNSILQVRVIQHVLKEVYQDEIHDIHDEHVDKIRTLIFNKQPNLSFFLPHKIRIVKAYNHVIFEYIKNAKMDYEYKIEHRIDLPNGMSLEIINETDSKNNYVTRLNSQEIKLPLFVRNRRDGDKIELKGMNGSKKIKDIFIDAKIDRVLRDNYPIVTDSRGVIVFVPGLKKSKFDKRPDEKYDIIVKCN